MPGPDRCIHIGAFVLFINGPASSSVEALIEGMRLLNPESRMAGMYQGWVDAYRSAQAAEQDQ